MLSNPHNGEIAMTQALGHQYLIEINSPVEIQGSISVNSSSNSGGVPIGVWLTGGGLGLLIGAIIVGSIWWWKSQQKIKNTVDLSEVLKNIKKEIREAQKPENPDQGSMFSFGSVTVNLETVIDQNGAIKLIPFSTNDSGLSAQFNHRNTQSLTLQLNPLKVVDGKQPHHVKILFSSQSGQSDFPSVIEADFVEIGNVFYLWLKENNEREHWIKASDIATVEITGEEQTSEQKRSLIFSQVASE
jgi:hypothetical protein